MIDVGGHRSGAPCSGGVAGVTPVGYRHDDTRLAVTPGRPAIQREHHDTLVAPGARRHSARPCGPRRPRICRLFARTREATIDVFRAALVNAGYPATRVDYPGLAHAYLNCGRDGITAVAAKAADDMLAFWKQYLVKAAPSR